MSEREEDPQPASKPPLVQTPALGFSIQTDLGAGRVCTLQTHLPNDCSLRELNEMLDKFTSAGDRQRAHYRVEELERDLEKLQKEQGQHTEDLARIDCDYALKQEERQKAAEKALKSADNYEVEAKRHWESKKRGPFKMDARDRGNVSRLQKEVEDLKAEMAKAQAEHELTHANSKTTMARRAEIIAKLQEEIERCRKVVADGLK